MSETIVFGTAVPKPEEVLRDTWGHMAAKPKKVYTGYVIFAVGCYGGNSCEAVKVEFKDSRGRELDGGPWMYDAVQSLMTSQKVDRGEIYRWEGEVKGYKFKGHLRKLSVENQ